MGNAESNESAAVKRQAEGFSNPMYRLLDLGGGGLLFDLSKRAMITGNTAELDEAIRSKIKPYLYNEGAGKWIHCAHLACLRNRDRPKSKQFDAIKDLGEAAFSFQFEGSSLLEKLTEGTSPETHPHLYTEHCWNVENRGAVGETTFHVCFLMGTPTHMFCAKRILKWFPKLLHDIYLSEEYYGENVLHMGCVAEDASLVKWLLDIGSDFHRRCYGNFFCCDDQKVHRMDNLQHEEVDIPLRTNYHGYVSWGEYAHNFAAVLNQEEIFRLILAKGGDCDLQDTNGCSASHIMVVYDNIKMFDLVVECGAAINITNRLGLTPLTLAAYLAKMDMFFHIASIERDVYWQLGNITCSAYPLKHLDTIDSDTGVLNKISALNLIVFGPKLEHLDLIEYVIVDLLKVKWKTFVKREFFKQMAQFSVFFSLAITAFITRPPAPDGGCGSPDQAETLNQTWLNNTVNNLSLELSNWTEVIFNNESCETPDLVGLGDCYLYNLDSQLDIVRCVCEVLIVILSLLFILKALRELSFLGLRVFMENMQLCPSRVIFLLSCCLLQTCIPARIFCFYNFEDFVGLLVMLSNGLYFLFFCRGFKLVGPMVIMIYRMLAQDLVRFGMIYSMFIMGFSQAYYIIFSGYTWSGDEDDDEDNPLETPVESFIQMFIMSLGEFGDLWDTFDSTKHAALAKVQWFIFMSLLVILLLNLLIAMMGDTYAKIAEIKNEWMRQWARMVLMIERSIPPKERLRQQNRYCDIDTQGNKALVMKQYLDDEKVDEISEIIEMKITHRRNLERRKAKFGLESGSDLGKNLVCSQVINPDSSDGSPPEDPYA